MELLCPSCCLLSWHEAANHCPASFCTDHTHYSSILYVLQVSILSAMLHNSAKENTSASFSFLQALHRLMYCADLSVVQGLMMSHIFHIDHHMHLDCHIPGKCRLYICQLKMFLP